MLRIDRSATRDREREALIGTLRADWGATRDRDLRFGTVDSERTNSEPSIPRVAGNECGVAFEIEIESGFEDSREVAFVQQRTL